MAKTSTVTSLDDAESAAVAEAAGAKADVVNVAGKNADKELSGKKAVIRIHESNDEHGADAIPVGINGFMYQIPRGKEVRVPVEVLEVLDNAIQRTYIAKDGITTGERNVPRHAYQVISKES